MNITFSMLLERIAHAIGQSPLSVQCSSNTPIRAVSVFSMQRTLNEDTLYISASVPPVSQRPLHLLCIAGEPSAETSGGNLALFPASVHPDHLTSAAQDALSEYIRWGDHILEMVYADQGLNAIVDFAYSTFKNPMLIYDSSLKVLAYTRNDGSTDRMWQDTVRKGTVNSMNAEEASELLRYVNRLNHSPIPFKHSAKDLTDPFYNCNILLSGRRVGMVALMEKHHTISQGELDLLQAFCYMLSFEIQKSAILSENRSVIYHQLIEDLLEGSIRDASMLRSRLTATRWNPSAYMRVVFFHPVNDFMAKGEIQQAFDHLLALSVGRCIQHEHEIILLLSCKSPQLDEHNLQILNTFCTAHQLRCGISDAYDNLLETHLVAPQASLALEIGTGQAITFDSVRFANLLRFCLYHPRPVELLHPSVIQLAEHDRLHGTDYLPTLEALLDAQFNQMLAARALHIHRTTLIYRLQRISEMTGLRLDDAQEMLHVHLSLRISRS